MNNIFEVIGTYTVSISRRHFIAGTAAVAGGGLAIGLAATWSSSAQAHALTTVGTIKQTLFTKDDIKLMDRCANQGCREGWDRSYTSEYPSGWLRTTPMNSHLASNFWRFLAERDGARVTDIGFDFKSLMDYMQEGGRLVEVSAGLNQSWLSPEAIADRVNALWAFANKSGPVVATQIILIVFARNDRPSGWENLFHALDDVLTEGRHTYLESSIEVGETASVCLWIAKETR